ncbi:MAG: hypothetical protein ACOX4R_07720 [Lentihominibacter sp.]|jgi:hypothetical protein
MLKIKSQLEYFLQYYENLSVLFGNELKNFPEGNLARNINHGKHYFIWAKQIDGKYLRKGIHTDQHMINTLARKAYISKCFDRCNSNVAALSDLIEIIDDLNPDEIINSLPEAYRLLPPESFFNSDSTMNLHAELISDTLSFTQKNAHLSELLPLSPEIIKARCDAHRQWGEMEFDQEPKIPDVHIHTTSRGERTRAKSELIILEQLYSYTIPSRYEMRIYVSDPRYVNCTNYTLTPQTPYDKYFAPDFTFETADGSLLFWEHAGMMDDPSYRARHIQKLNDYRQAGIVPWQNLIVTYDRDGAANMQIIKSTILYHLLPRL